MCGLRTSKGDRATILGGVRLKAIGAERAAAAALSPRYITPWLDPDHKAEEERRSAPPAHIGGGATMSAPPKPPRAPAGPDEVLTETQRETMLELAHKLASAPDAQDADGMPMANAPRYWLDAHAGELVSKGLIAFMHSREAGPRVGMTSAGRAWVAANPWAEGEGIEAGQLYATPWLNPADASAARLPEVSTSEIMGALGEEEDDRDLTAEEAACVLERVKEEIAEDEPDFAGLLEAAGVLLPIRVGVGDNAGAIFDAQDREILTFDVNREHPDDLVIARAILVMTAINQAAGVEIAKPEGEASDPRPEPAVPIRRSITPDYIVCLEDGRKFKSLKRHLRVKYNLSPEQYRERWGLPLDYPMVAPNYARQREMLARQIALGLPVEG